MCFEVHIKCVLTGKIVAYFDNQFLTIRHCSCEWLLHEMSNDICHVCKGYKKSYLYSKLRSIRNRTEEQSEAACEVSSQENFSKLDTPQRYKRLSNRHTTIVKQKKKIKSLQEKLEQLEQHVCSNGVFVDKETNEGLSQLLSMYKNDAIKDTEDDPS